MAPSYAHSLFSALDSRLELLSNHLEVHDMSSSAVKVGDTARLLVGSWKYILEMAGDHSCVHRALALI